MTVITKNKYYKRIKLILLTKIGKGDQRGFSTNTAKTARAIVH